MKQFDKYRMVDGATPLAARYFNPVWQDIDLRLASLEEVKIAWQAAVDEVVRFGLVRIDELINEPLQAVLALSSQAESTSAELEQLRQLAESRTTALALLIETLRADTGAQVGLFIESANQRIRLHQEAAQEQLALWRAQRTSELDQWVSDFEDALQNARQEIDAQVTRLAHHKIEQRSASFTLQAADIATHFEIQTTAVVTLPDATSLRSGWWCKLRNNGEGDITLQAPAGSQIDGLDSYVMYSGECRLLQCDGVHLRGIVITPFHLVKRTSFDFIKPPGYRAFDMDVRGATGGGGGGGSGALRSGTGYVSAGGGGGSGGAGARMMLQLPFESLLAITPFIVGAAGVGGLSATTQAGAEGGGVAGGDGGDGGETQASIVGVNAFIQGGKGGKGGKGGSIGAQSGTGGLGGAIGVGGIPPQNPNGTFPADRYGLRIDGSTTRAIEFTGAPGVIGGFSPNGNPADALGGAKGEPITGEYLAGSSGAGGDGGPGLKGLTAASVSQAGANGVPGKVMISGVL